MTADWDHIRNDAAHFIRKPEGGMPYFRVGFLNQRGPLSDWKDGVTSEYAMNYVIKGEGSYQDETGYARTLTAGSIVQRLPERKHTLQFHSDKVIRCFVAVPASFHDTMLLMRAFSSTEPVIDFRVSREIINGVYLLLDEMKRTSQRQFSRCAMKMFQFLVDMHQQIKAERTPALSSQHAELSEKARKLLSADPEERTPLEAFARRLNMSYSKFRQVFRQHTGVSPGDFRIQQRIQRAQQLLIRDNLSIKAVAEALNYPDEFTFAKQFKKVTGISPGKYQKKTLL